MQKKISLFVALLFVFNLFAFSVSAADVTITSITYPSGKTSYSVGDTVSIKGNCTTGKDLVLRVYNEKDVLIYTDTILAYNNTTGTFEFTGFDIPATTSTGTLNYKVVVTETQDSNETTNVATQTMTVNGGSSNDTPSRYVGPITPSVPDEPWVVPGNKPGEKPIDPGNGPASTDTLNENVIKAAAGVGSASAAVAFIDKTTKATDTEALGWESTRNTIAVSVESMMANISSKKINTSSSTNKLLLDKSSVSDSDIKKYTDTEKTLKDAVNKNKITLNRELSKEYVVNTSFSASKKANITIYKEFVEKLEKIGIETLTINDKNFRVSYSMAELKEMIGDEKFTSFDIDATAMSNNNKKIAVNFDTNKTQSVKISFPGLNGDSKYMAIVDENGNPVGGRYNPATGAIEAKISESGIYQIVNNEKDFNDIKDKSEEMRESIKILAAKGIIQGTSETEFSPDDTISRAEIAALLLRVLSQVDPNADGGFTDVKKSDWFYGTAGSAKNYGLIVGFEDNTFRGNAVIEKDQILTIASRVLQKEMKYKMPENSSEWLTFSDASEIADWARNDIALATMANIITRTADNTIQASEDITRGDAALIVMRLFYKIW